MGMTIEDCTKMLIAKEKCMERETSGIDTDCNSHNCDECSLCYEQGTMGEQKEVLKFAVDTMRKYQKIEQIVSDFRKYQKGITWGFGGEKYMQMVSEVVEDEND